MIDASLTENLFNTALLAAQQAGKFVFESLNKTLKINFKGRANIVTQIDKGAEKIIIDTIREKFTDHQILSEESPPVNTDSQFKWIIDPLDGTTNFVHRFPCFSISIALELNGKVIIGVIYDPIRHELFSTIKGHGAYLNKQSIHVSKVAKLHNSLLATGFPYELRKNFYKNMDIFKVLYENCQGIRRMGSAAIDMCYVACGRLDGFWEFDLNPWDVAAGSLLVSEAGGKLADFAGKEFSIYEKQVLATNGLIESEMIEIFEKSLTLT